MSFEVAWAHELLANTFYEAKLKQEGNVFFSYKPSGSKSE
jgi:hypothetical protein